MSRISESFRVTAAAIVRASVHPNNMRPAGRHATTPEGKLVSLALRSALTELKASPADAARWCSVTRKTMQRWVSGLSPVSIALLLKSKRLGPVFLRALSEQTRAL